MARTSEDIVDEWLVLRCRSGDVEAMGRLVKRWEGRVLRHAWRMTRDADGAMDVAQESWMSIARGIGAIEDPRAFRAWALGIVTRRSADWIRGRVRHRRATQRLRDLTQDNPMTTPHPTNQPELHEEAQAVHLAMETLTHDHAVVLGLRYADGLGVAEIAVALDIPIGTVKSRLFHAREALKQAIETHAKESA